MGRKNQKKRRRTPKQLKQPQSNFLVDHGAGCYIARREDNNNNWIIDWEDVDPEEFVGEQVPEIALDEEEQTLSLCNLDDSTKVAYVTVYTVRTLGRDGQVLPQAKTTDNNGVTNSCVTFIVLCPPRVFVHLCYLDIPIGHKITDVRIENDFSEWRKHPNPSDEHPQRLGFPLQGGPFLCTQGEGGELTHFFSGNLHAIDFSCPIGTPILAVANGVVVEAKDSNTLTGIAVTNLFEWNSVILKLDGIGNEAKDHESNADPLYVEYVHIEKSCVKAGDRVEVGQIIGTSGSVGFSPEPHLHFSAFRSSEPDAPTVRVKFSSTKAVSDEIDFLPRAGLWYDKTGPVEPSKKT